MNKFSIYHHSILSKLIITNNSQLLSFILTGQDLNHKYNSYELQSFVFVRGSGEKAKLLLILVHAFV